MSTAGVPSQTLAGMGQASRPGSYGGLRVLIVGGGVAGLEAMLALRELAGDLVDVELLAPDHHFWYRPLAVAEPFGRSQAYHFELPAVAGEAGASFTPGALTTVDPDRQVAHTSRGAELAYDVLVVACGARATPALEGALTFRGPSDTERFQSLLAELEAGAVRRLVFACPASAGWSLPLYELALLTAVHLEEREIIDVELTLVTPEPSALARLGAVATEAVEALLAEHAVQLVTEARPASFAARRLVLADGRTVKADRVVALPRLQGLRVTGLPHDRDGFVATGADGLVEGLADVYAAGDITRFPVKQGGIAAQQADVVAETIAVLAGADVEPTAFEPVIHALLLSGGEPLYIRAELAGDDPQCTVSTEPLWWPPSKVAGRYLSPFLASRVAVESNAYGSRLDR
jgi:sulfide:quinone oxidoreductase